MSAAYNDKLATIAVQKTSSISILVVYQHKGVICRKNVLQIDFLKILKYSYFWKFFLL